MGNPFISINATIRAWLTASIPQLKSIGIRFIESNIDSDYYYSTNWHDRRGVWRVVAILRRFETPVVLHLCYAIHNKYQVTIRSLNSVFL